MTMTKNKFFALLITLTMAVSLMVGCASQEKPKVTESTGTPVETPSLESSKGTQYPLTISDSTGHEIVIDRKPQKVVSVAPSITETIFALGAESQLVGRTDYCDFPAEVSQIATIGTLQEPNIEKIVELEADLVIASTHFKEDVLKKLQELEIPVIVLNPNDSFEGVYDVIEKLGLIFDQKTESQEVVSTMKKKISSVKDKVASLAPPTVYYVVGYGEFGDFTAGGGTFISEMIHDAGGRNVADDVDGWSYSVEKLVEHDPEILLVSKYFGAKQGVIEGEGYKELTAVKTGKIHEIDNNLIDRQGPRLADGFEELARAIHPDAFK